GSSHPPPRALPGPTAGGPPPATSPLAHPVPEARGLDVVADHLAAGDPPLLELGEGPGAIVVDPAELDPQVAVAVLEQGVAGSGIAVERPGDAAAVDDVARALAPVHRLMGVAADQDRVPARAVELLDRGVRPDPVVVRPGGA